MRENLYFSKTKKPASKNKSSGRGLIAVKINVYDGAEVCTPCPCAPVRCAPATSPVNKFAENAPRSQILPPWPINANTLKRLYPR